jgi:DnaJ-class molecular chaperone
MSIETFYDILEIPETSTPDEIKKAYRKLSLLNHPDKTNNDETKTIKFKKINEAYNTLCDEKLKVEYDRNLHYKKNGMGNMGPGMGVFHQGSGINPEDIIAQLFMNGILGGMGPGMAGMGHGPINIKTFHSKPVCIIKKIIIPLRLAYIGGSCPIEIERTIVENNIHTVEKETVYITLDRGVDNDEIILLQGRGNIVNNIRGDVKIIVEIENTSEFVRQGLDLKLTKKITLKEALTGFNFSITHLSGNMYNVNNAKGNIIPPQYNKKLPSMGMVRGEFTGDLIINFEVVFPTSLDISIIDKLSEIL